MKKTVKKKIVLIVILLLIVVVGIVLFLTHNSEGDRNTSNEEKDVLIYEWSDFSTPGETYSIKINKNTKVLDGEFSYGCSAVNCEGYTKKYSITLTEEEYKKIMILWFDRETLSPILEILCEDTEIFYNSYEECNEDADSEEECKNSDLNSDGKITSRECGNRWLDIAIEEKQNNK